MTFRVQAEACRTCIYRKDSIHDLQHLENEVRDEFGFFKDFRICHHSEDVCCRGFWNRHKDKFQLGQVAQRLGIVEFVHVDNIC